MLKKLNVPSVTLSHFSPLGIIFTSRKGAYWYDITVAVIGSILVPFSVNRLCLTNSSYTAGTLGVLCVGLMLMIVPLVIRGRSAEISFLSATRQIIGVSKSSPPLFFSDVYRLQLHLTQDKCSLTVFFKNDVSIVLFNDFPLNLALRIGVHLGKLLEIPVTNQNGKPIRHGIEIDWTLPYQLPSGWFPLEYTLFSIAYASGISIMLSYNLHSIFLFDVAPKWLFMPVLSFPASQLLKNVHHNRNYYDAAKLLAFFILLCIGFIIWSSMEPAITFLGLMPGAILLFFLLVNYSERKKIGLLLLPGIVVLLFSIVFSVFVSYHYHSFFLLDASVIDQIHITRSAESTVTLEYPSDIKLFLGALQDSNLYRSSSEPRSASLNAHIVRPAGRDYFIELHREGMGSKAGVVGRLSCKWFKGPLFLATINSVSADTTLESFYGVWPPGY